MDVASAEMSIVDKESRKLTSLEKKSGASHTHARAESAQHPLKAPRTQRKRSLNERGYRRAHEGEAGPGRQGFARRAKEVCGSPQGSSAGAAHTYVGEIENGPLRAIEPLMFSMKT